MKATCLKFSNFNAFALNKDTVIFSVGCGTTREVLSVTYKRSEMKINFKFYGDFGYAFGKITFQKGNFIAEPENQKNGRSGIQVRKATDEDWVTGIKN